MNYFSSNLLNSYGSGTSFNVSQLGGVPVANQSYWGNLALSNSGAGKLGFPGGAGASGGNVPWGLIVQGAADTINEGLSMYMEHTVAKAKSKAYRSQARLVKQAADTKNKYLNEAYGQQVWNIYDQSRALAGQQITSMAASGFTDVSSGDKRLLQDTINKTEAAVEGINRTAYLQQFETNRAAAMEASRLEYAAKMQDRIRKNSSGLRGLARASLNIGLSAAGRFFNVDMPRASAGSDINVYGSATNAY